MTEWSILLLGGTTASGKSTSAWKLARQLGIGCVSADSLWKGVIAITTQETHPILHQWPRIDEAPGEPGPLAELHIKEALTMMPALDAFIDSELLERNHIIFHGAWLTPELAARKCAASDRIRAVFIDEPRTEDILESIVARSRVAEPSERQRVMAEVARLYGDWLRAEAIRNHVPLVPARPHETLADRILEAAEPVGAGSKPAQQRHT